MNPGFGFPVLQLAGMGLILQVVLVVQRMNFLGKLEHQLCNLSVPIMELWDLLLFVKMSVQYSQRELDQDSKEIFRSGICQELIACQAIMAMTRFVSVTRWLNTLIAFLCNNMNPDSWLRTGRTVHHEHGNEFLNLLICFPFLLFTFLISA